MNNNKSRNFILIILCVCCLLAIYYLPGIFRKDKDALGNYKYTSIKKDSYDINEYVPIMINDEQMSKKYLMDFISYIVDDIDYSYNLVDKKYRDLNFVDVDSYKKFIYGLSIPYNDSVTKYVTYERSGYKFYDIYDSVGNRFIFKTKGVLQYSVLFDDFDDRGENE